VHEIDQPADLDEELRGLATLRDVGALSTDEFERRAVVTVCRHAAGRPS
jgi:hypothetical protein